MVSTTGGNFNAKPYGYQANYYGNPNTPAIPIKDWAADHGVTVKQCHTLLRRGELAGVMRKRRMFVTEVQP